MNLLDEQANFPSGQLGLISCILSDAGRKRPNNEDYAMAFMPDDPLEMQTSGCLFVVADGVGGRTRGEETSRYATGQVVAGYYELADRSPTERLSRVLREVGNDLYSHSAGDAPAHGATTLVAAAILENQLTVANIGDSRAYLIHDGQAQQITRDHNQLSELLRLGALSVEEVENVDGLNRLTRSLGGQRDVEVDIFANIPIYPGDKLLLCTDGLTRYIDDVQIALLAGMGPPEQVCELLVDWANQSGGEDNITVLLVEVQPESVGLYVPGGLESSALGPEYIPMSSTQPAHEPQGRIAQPVGKRVIRLSLLLSGLLILALLVWQVLSRFGEVAPVEHAAATSTTELSIIMPAQGTIEPAPTEGIRVETPTVIVLQASPTPPVQQRGNTCVWTVESGQSLFSIIRRFDLPYNADDTYYYFEECDLEEDVCSGEPVEIESHASIFAGWHIVITDMRADDCTQGEGSWVQAGD